jgi:hypothetical protein
MLPCQRIIELNEIMAKDYYKKYIAYYDKKTDLFKKWDTAFKLIEDKVAIIKEDRAAADVAKREYEALKPPIMTTPYNDLCCQLDKSLMFDTSIIDDTGLVGPGKCIIPPITPTNPTKPPTNPTKPPTNPTNPPTDPPYDPNNIKQVFEYAFRSFDISKVKRLEDIPFGWLVSGTIVITVVLALIVWFISWLVLTKSTTPTIQAFGRIISKKKRS